MQTLKEYAQYRGTSETGLGVLQYISNHPNSPIYKLTRGMGVTRALLTLASFEGWWGNRVLFVVNQYNIKKYLKGIMIAEGLISGYYDDYIKFMTAAGIGSSILGSRFDRIIFDEVNERTFEDMYPFIASTLSSSGYITVVTSDAKLLESNHFSNKLDYMKI